MPDSPETSKCASKEEMDWTVLGVIGGKPPKVRDRESGEG
jgi:hypothetical protein